MFQVTLAATSVFNTSFAAFDRSFACGVGMDGTTIDLNCPITPDTHTCDFATYGGGGTYFFDYTCPYVEPTCLYWDETTMNFEGDDCTLVSGYSSDAVTCDCSRTGTFVLGANVTQSQIEAFVTAAPTISPTFIPTSQPTSVPVPAPTVIPTNLPISSPSSIPTSLPTTKPTPRPSFIPSNMPTSLPTYHPTPDPTLLPSFFPTSQPTMVNVGGGGGRGTSNASTTYIIIGAIAFVLLLGCAFFGYRRNYHKQFGEDLETQESIELGSSGAISGSPVVKVKVRPGGKAKRQTSFTTKEDATTEDALEMLALGEGGRREVSIDELADEYVGDLDEDDDDDKDVAVQGRGRGEGGGSSEIKDKLFVGVSAIANNHDLKLAEKLEKLSQLGLSDADFDNAKRFILTTTIARHSGKNVFVPNVPDIQVQYKDKEAEVEEETTKKNIGELSKDKQLISVAAIVNNDNITIAEKMVKLADLNLNEKDFENAKKFVLARSKAGLGAQEAEPATSPVVLKTLATPLPSSPTTTSSDLLQEEPKAKSGRGKGGKGGGKGTPRVRSPRTRAPKDVL
jgi:hypothetical protein